MYSRCCVGNPSQMTSFRKLGNGSWHTNDLWSIMSCYWLRRLQNLPPKTNKDPSTKKAFRTGSAQVLKVKCALQLHLTVRLTSFTSMLFISSVVDHSISGSSISACICVLLSTSLGPHQHWLRGRAEGVGQSTCITFRAHILPALP